MLAQPPSSGASPSDASAYGAAASLFQPCYGQVGAASNTATAAPFSVLQGAPPFASSSSFTATGGDVSQAIPVLPPQALRHLVTFAHQKQFQDTMQEDAQNLMPEQEQQQAQEQHEDQRQSPQQLHELHQLHQLHQLQRLQQLRQEHELQEHLEEQQDQVFHSSRPSPLAVSALLASSATSLANSPASSRLPSPLLQPDKLPGIDNSAFELDMDASFPDQIGNGGFGVQSFDTGGFAGSFDASAASSASGSAYDQDNNQRSFDAVAKPEGQARPSLPETQESSDFLEKIGSGTGLSSSDARAYSSGLNSLVSNKSSKNNSFDSTASSHNSYDKTGRSHDVKSRSSSVANPEASLDSFEAASLPSAPGVLNTRRAASNGAVPDVTGPRVPEAAPLDQLGNSTDKGEGNNDSCVLLFAVVVDNSGQQNSAPIPVGSLSLADAASWGIFFSAMPPTPSIDGSRTSATSNSEDAAAKRAETTAASSADAAAAARLNPSASEVEWNYALAYEAAQAAANLAAQSANQAQAFPQNKAGPSFHNSSHAASSSYLPSNTAQPSMSHQSNSGRSTPPISPAKRSVQTGAPPEPRGPPPPINNGNFREAGGGKFISSGRNLGEVGGGNGASLEQADRLGARSVSVDTMGVIEALSGLRKYSAQSAQQRQAEASAYTAEQEQSEAQEQACARAEQQVARAQAQRRAHEQAYARAQALEQARALAHIEAQARAQMLAKARAQALAEAHSQAEANAHALAQALAQAQAQLYILDTQPPPPASAAATDSAQSNGPASRASAQTAPTESKAAVGLHAHLTAVKAQAEPEATKSAPTESVSAETTAATNAAESSPTTAAGTLLPTVPVVAPEASLKAESGAGRTEEENGNCRVNVIGDGMLMYVERERAIR
jgi:hypothetical protein